MVRVITNKGQTFINWSLNFIPNGSARLSPCIGRLSCSISSSMFPRQASPQVFLGLERERVRGWNVKNLNHRTYTNNPKRKRLVGLLPCCWPTPSKLSFSLYLGLLSLSILTFFSLSFWVGVCNDPKHQTMF